MESVLESQRATHEQLDRLEATMVEVLLRDDGHSKARSTQKQRMIVAHRAADLAQRIVDRSKILQDSYDDPYACVYAVLRS